MNAMATRTYDKSMADYLMNYSDLLTSYDPQLLQLHETCAQLLSTFPPRLHQTSEVILQRSTGPWHRINWAQPFILSSDWFIADAPMQKIALAHALTDAHAHIQEIATQCSKQFNEDLLPLGSLLYTQALRQYQQIFEPAALFWRLLEGYHLEWTEAMLWARGRQSQWGEVKPYSQEEILQMGGMQALLKIGCSAVAMLAGKQRMLMPLSSVLDQLHVAIQLMDGIVHWRQDLKKRRATYFLTETALALNVQNMEALQRPNLEQFLGACNLPAKATGRALEHLQAAQKIAGRLNAPELTIYLKELESFFRQIPQLIVHSSSDAHAFLTTASLSTLLY